MPDKIAFLKLSSFSHVNISLEEEFRRLYPNHDLEVIDIFKIVRNNKIILYLNILFIIVEYFPDLISGKKKIKECFIRNSFMYIASRLIIKWHLRKDEYLFTFQTQALFDGSKKNVPHFLYTDNTMFVNKLYPGFNLTKMPSKLWLYFEQRTYNRADKIFTMSNHVTRSFLKDYQVDPEKVIKVYAGCNIKKKNMNLIPRNYNNKNIIFVGGNFIRKGGPDLLEAFKLVLVKHPDAKLTIVSRRLANPNIPNCTVYNNITLSELAEKYVSASIFCLPTRLEPFGMVFLEAMMYSLPIVATKIGAIPEFTINGENGYVVEPYNSVELADALIKLLDDPEKCEKFGKRSYALYQQFYTWETVSQRMKDVIEKELNIIRAAEPSKSLLKSKAGIPELIK